MIGVLILTHGELAKGFYNAASLIIEDLPEVDYYQINHGDDFSIFRDKVTEKIKKLDNGKGVLILTDLFGASPYNAAALAKKECPEIDYRIVTGINLPMLLEALLLRKNDTINELTNKIMNIGREGIKEFFTELKKEEENYNVKNSTSKS